MAIYHLEIKTHSRSNGESAVAAAAYRAGQNLADADEKMHRYARRQRGVMSASLHLPDGVAPTDRQTLWRMAEAAEKRKNSTVAREVEISLPHELPQLDQIALAQQMSRWLVDRYSIAVDCAVHVPGKGKDNRNVHCHLLCTTRVFTPDGMGAKTRILDDKKSGPVEVEAIRERWASLCNAALARHGVASRIDHRSYERQGIARVPTLHVGKGRFAKQRKSANDQIIAIEAQIEGLKKRRIAIEEAKARAAYADLIKHTLVAPTVSQLVPPPAKPEDPPGPPRVAHRKFRR